MSETPKAPRECLDALCFFERNELQRQLEKYKAYADENAFAANKAEIENAKLRTENSKLQAQLYVAKDSALRTYDGLTERAALADELQRENEALRSTLKSALDGTNAYRESREEALAKYRHLELANKELTRNDHVNFGKLVSERDEARRKLELAREALATVAECGNCGGCKAKARDCLGKINGK